MVPGVRVTANYEEVLRASDVDIVSIATPNHLHAAQAVAAAEARKHFVLEKPTGLDAAELVRIRDAVRRAGVRTIVSFVLRYNPFLKFARWLRTDGWLGDIRFARTQYSRASPAGTAGGTGCAPARADAATCSPPAATRSTRCAGARGSSRSRSARSTRSSPKATSSRRR